MGPAERLVLSGKIDRIGLAGSHFEMKDADGKVLTKRQRPNGAASSILAA